MKKLYTFFLLSCSLFLNAQVPTASFALSQSSVCPSATIQVNNLSSGGATSYTFVVDGTNSVSATNPVISFTMDGIHYIELYAQNANGVSPAYGQTLMVYPSPVVSTGTAGTTGFQPVPGQTNGWLPLVWTFADPLPPGAVLSGVTLTFTGVDQGWGGTGDPAIFYVAGRNIGYGILLHSIGTYTIQKFAPYFNYNYGGNNTLEMYFTGYPGWQGFFLSGNLTLHYQTNIGPATYCGGTSITLNGIGASTYTWMPTAPNGQIFTPQSSAIYTVTGTSSVGCAGTMTQQVNISTPTITAASGAICPGDNFVINPSGASTYTVSGGNFTVSPAASISYSVTGTNTLGCVSLSPAVVNVTVVPHPLVTVNSGTACVGSTFTLQPSGAASYSFQNGTPIQTITATSNFTVMGYNSLGCAANVPAFANVTAIPLPLVSASSGTICEGNSFTILPTGAQSYSFSSGSAIVSPASTTTYTVYGYNAQVCMASTSCTVQVDACIGLREITQEDRFTIFPNPTTGTIFIKSTKEETLKVFNQLGIQVDIVLANTTLLEWPVHLPNGMYFLRSNDGALVTKLVIQQ